MKLRFGDLPNSNTCVKLSMVSFESPQKNLDVYRFISSLKPLQEFFNSERKKLLVKYGKTDDKGVCSILGEDNVKGYKEGLEAILRLEIKDHIPNPLLEEKDFSEDFCRYPDDKNLWMNAADIDSILTFCEKLKD